ncbi:MAG: M23 family metallopeptidase [Jatrophihabitantaceae bacterium]
MSRPVVTCCIVLLALNGPALNGPALAGPALSARAAPIAVTVSPAAPVAARPVSYAPPLPIDVLRGFEPPPQPYAAGHRGVDLASATGTEVQAAAAGTVSFAGPVAGRGVVVIAHADGVSTEYEPIAPLVRIGAAIERGQVIGRVRGAHGSCPLGGCLHWGARRAGTYFDPLSLLQSLGPVRLLPWAAQARG